VNRGARGVGGCCRTTPRDIRVIAQTLKDKHM
jgi:S-methylmethionine-dependent homocysteine/selenocysteine methylase